MSPLRLAILALAALSATDAGGQIDVWNADSKNVLRLSANKHGGDVAVWNTKGNSVAGAWATDDGGAVATWDDQGARTSRLDSADGLGQLALATMCAQSPATP